MNLPIRAVGVVIKDGKVLLIKRENEGKRYYVFPGGGVEEGEKVEDAVKREVWEETSIQASVEKLLYRHFYSAVFKRHSEQHFYLCKYLRGEPKLGNFNEKEDMEKHNDYFEPLWVDLDKLPELLVYPLEIRDWLIEDVKNNFRDVPKEEKIDIKNLRQTF